MQGNQAMMLGTSDTTFPTSFPGSVQSNGPSNLNDPQHAGTPSAQNSPSGSQYRANSGPPPRTYNSPKAPSAQTQGTYASASTTFVGQKRNHASAFAKPHTQPNGSGVAPSVPSFYQPLLPPGPSSSLPGTGSINSKGPSQHNKPQAKNNLLGLTPKAGYESSEDENEEDEESKLADTIKDSSASGLEIAHLGQTICLRNPAEIASWVAERKKRWPTQARVVEAMEKRRLVQDVKRKEQAAQQAAREEKREQHRQMREAREKEWLAQGAARQRETQKQQADNAKRELERLRGLLAVEKKKVAAAERQAVPSSSEGGDRKGACDTDKQAASAGFVIATAIAGDETSPDTPDLSVKSKQGHHASDSLLADGSKCGERELKFQSDVSVSDSSASMSASDTDDWTSSSGSSPSETDSDAQTPEQMTSKQDQAVEPPVERQVRTKAPCHSFARSGKCKYGGRCRFSHKQSGMKPRGHKAKRHQQEEQQKGTRISLYQRLVNQEKENEAESDRKAKEESGLA
ncbi:uncharacterized protein KY384_004173 [Bacidia gigantensis]|uniref:uncharacterized protein n=1 Tax=Bacidia gigantensis TaxID=2732470 RepID=UPI001D04BE1D|nr:uncharacterized protein KY384_004173 [Bacidia gigantensis]KAG8530816.1 hypothetical protein KY384_004173 [Bacidia gigantensis]